MTSLAINDLSFTEELDVVSLRTLRGGMLTMPVEPDNSPGGAPGPWVLPAMPAMPAMPAIPGFAWPAPRGWCGTGSDPVAEQPGDRSPPSDRMHVM